jgi:WD40 repeat protein
MCSAGFAMLVDCPAVQQSGNKARGPGKNFCVLGRIGAVVQVWDLSSRKVIRSYEGHAGGVNTVLFHPDGTCIASGSTDGSLKVSQQLRTPLPCSAFRDFQRH